MKTTYQSKSYSPEAVTARYVRTGIKPGEFSFCEVGCDARYDIRQGTVTADEVPAEIIAQAEALRGTYPGYVAWPVN